MSYKPEGFGTVTPHLMIDGANKALGVYQKALKAELLGKLESPDGKVLHAALKVGSSILFVSDPLPASDRHPPKGEDLSSVGFYLYVEDCDKAHAHAVGQGFAEVSAPEDMFWGDRTAVARDDFGYNWTFATHLRDVNPEDMEKMIKEMSG